MEREREREGRGGGGERERDRNSKMNIVRRKSLYLSLSRSLSLSRALSLSLALRARSLSFARSLALTVALALLLGSAIAVPHIPPPALTFLMALPRYRLLRRSTPSLPAPLMPGRKSRCGQNRPCVCVCARARDAHTQRIAIPCRAGRAPRRLICSSQPFPFFHRHPSGHPNAWGSSPRACTSAGLVPTPKPVLYQIP